MIFPTILMTKRSKRTTSPKRQNWATSWI